MTTRLDKRQLVRGALLAAAIAGCQSGAPTGEAKDDPAGTGDINDAIAALPEAEVLLRDQEGRPLHVIGDLGKADPTQTDEGLASDARLRPTLVPLLKVFRLKPDDLTFRHIYTDASGDRYFKYRQTFNGLEVVGAGLTIHVDVKGGIVGANGTARGDISTELGKVSISDGAANAKIAGDVRFAGLAITATRPVYIQTGDGAIFKAFEKIVEGKRGKDPVRDKVFVDVETGNVVAVHPTIHHARNRAVYSANNGTSLPGTLRRSEGGAAGTDLDVNAAYDNSGSTYDAYFQFFSRDSYNGSGAQLRSTVHYSVNYCNAFWDGTQMVYGDGDPSDNCLPLARSVDVTAHELTHAVTEYESGLVYSGESGGLNEALSDIFGAFVEAYVDGGKTGSLPISNDTFLVGEDILPPALRFMCDPAADGASRDVWSSTLGSVDVHYSSGPQNLVACLLAKGGQHPRGKTTTMVPSIGFEKMIRITFQAQVSITNPNTTYAMMRTQMEAAATALGYDQATKDAVGCAYAAISVGTAPASCGGTTPPPNPGDVTLSNGVGVAASDTTTGNLKFYKIDVPAGQTTLTVQLSGGSGDADLYVNFGAKPTLTSYQCRPYLNGNNETCTITPPSAGTYWIGLHAYATYSGATIKATYTGGGNTGDPYITNGVPQTNLSGASGSTKYYRIAVPAGKNLSIRISGGTGDADLYTRAGQRPTTGSYACRPYLSGNSETCTHNNATAGDWYIMVRGFSQYSGVQLIGSF